MKSLIPKFFPSGFVILFVTILLSCSLGKKSVNQPASTNSETGSGEQDAGSDKVYNKYKNRVDKKKDELDEVEDDLDDAEDELDEVEEELEEIEKKLKTTKLSAEERERLEDQKEDLEDQKEDLETRITSLNSRITSLTGELATAKTNLATAERERESARAERDCWKKTKYEICDRSQAVRDAIVAKISGKSACADIHYCDLETITTLDLSGRFDNSLSCTAHLLEFNKNDFKGLINLVELDLSGNCLYSSDADTNLESKENEGMFTYLPKLRRLKLHDTGVDKLPSNFFTAGNLQTLENGEVTVTSFIYCNDPTASFKDKLSSDKTPHDDRAYSTNPGTAVMKTRYCY